MNKLLLLLFFSLNLLATNSIASGSISQCIQPDGTIEFTNKACAKSNVLKSKKQITMRSSTLKNTRKSQRRKAPFRQQLFVTMQNKLIKAEAQLEIEQHAQLITNKIHRQVQTDSLKNAYDMVAATYVKLSKHIKKRHWEGLSIKSQTRRTHRLFEEILITQSNITSKEEFTQVIETAWKNYQKKSLLNIIGRNDP